MLKIYISNISKNQIGGGWSFQRNFRKGLKDKVEFVNNWQDSDIVFVFGITTLNKGEVHQAKKAGKKIVIRVDNIPRRSRNKRMHPTERLKEFGNMADLVVYQSQWCKKYAGYFIDNKNEVIINNGVDLDIFNNKDRSSDGKTYLYINYNDNPNKRFDEALYWFDFLWRKHKDIKLIIAGNAPKIYLQNPEYNWDLSVPAKVDYVGILESPEEVASLMRRCDYLLYPSFAEAYPNILLEAMACGTYPLFMNNEGGSMEVFNNSFTDNKITFNVKSIYDMSKKYLKEFNKLI